MREKSSKSKPTIHPPQSRHSKIASVAILTAALSAVEPLHAQSIWTGVASGSWATGTNWNPAAVPSASHVQFGNVTTQTVTLDAAQTAGTFEFSSANPYTINSGTGGTLAFSGTSGLGGRFLQNGSGTITINPLLGTDSNARTFDGSGAGAITLAGGYGGNAVNSAFVKNGDFSLAVQGNFGTGTSTVSVNAGILNLSGASGVFGTTGAINIGLAAATSSASSWSTGGLTSAQAVLELNNASVNNTNRYGNAVALGLRSGGAISLVGDSAGTAEAIGALTVTGVGEIKIDSTAGAAVNTLTFASLNGTGVANFANTGGTLGTAGSNPRILFTSAPSTTNSIVRTSSGNGEGVVNNKSFAVYDNTLGVQALSTFASTFTSGAVTAASNTNNIRINASGATTAAGGNVQMNTLTINNTSGSAQTLTISGSFNGGPAKLSPTLGIVFDGTSAFTIAKATNALVELNGAVVAVNNAALTISADLADTTTFTKVGDGQLILSGNRSNGGNATLYVGDGTQTDDVVISGNYLSGTLIKVGTGALAIQGSVANTSNLTLNQGLVVIDRGANQSTGFGSALAINGGFLAARGTALTTSATLTLANDVATAGGGFAGDQNITINGNTSVLLGGTNTRSLYNASTATVTLGAVSVSGGGGAGTLIVDGLGTTVISGVVSNGSTSLGLTKSGTGLLTLSNGANSYSNLTTINGGTLKFGANNAIPSSNVVTISSTNNTTSTLDLAGFNETIGGAGLTLGGGTATSAATVINSTGTSTLTLTGGGTALTYSASNNPLGATISVATLSLNATTQTFTIGDSSNAVIDLTISSVISTTGGAPTKAGAGTLLLSGVNTYTGTTTVNAGTLALGGNAPSGSAGTLGNATSIVLLGDTTGSLNASLLTNGAYTVGRIVRLQTGNSGVIRVGGNTSDASIFSGVINLGTSGSAAKSGVLVALAGGTATFSGVIDENGATGLANITIGDATHLGTVVLSNVANAYGGITTITNGATAEITKLAIGGSNSSMGNSAQAATNLVINGGTLQYTGAGGDSTGRSFTFDNNGATIDASAAANAAITFSGTGGALVASGTGNRTLTLTGASTGANTMTSVIANPSSGATALTKSGAGTWVVGGVNTYTGTTTISAGTLRVNSPGSLAAGSAVTVDGTSTLGGNGTIGGSVTVAASASLSPGASAGTLTVSGTLDISAEAGGAGTLSYELDALAGTNDKIIAGTLTIGTGVLGMNDFVFTNLGGLQIGTYKLITSGGIIGTLDAGNLTGSIGAFTGTLQINGNDLELVVGSAAPNAYSDWATLKGLTGLPGSSTDPAKGADPDGDGTVNLLEFATNGDPLSGSNNGLKAILLQDTAAPTGNELTYIIAVRKGVTFTTTGLSQTNTTPVDGLFYTVSGSLDLIFPGSAVSHVGSASDTAPVATGLPDLSGTAWEYHTFRLDPSEGLIGEGFIRAKVNE
ncbi:MAG: autotransporter-associated beta strand repeat-containing protein [Luteolibacter sp.]